MSAWNPALYLKYGDERTQPSIDLAARIRLGDPRRIIDLGCGPGNSTQVLRARWPRAAIEGLDNSEDMIAAARRECPGQTWRVGDIRDWQPEGPYDLVFSNAALQWVPDHAALIPQLLAAGSVFAVQIPAHHASPVHQEILAVSRQPRWTDRLEPARNVLTRHPPEFYYDLLAPRSKTVEMWETEYIHILDGPAAILEWFRGTGLRPFVVPLHEGERAAFEAELLERYAAAYPRRSDGKVLFPFRRLFFIAYSAA